jgi:hypothetical protein
MEAPKGAKVRVLTILVTATLTELTIYGRV